MFPDRALDSFDDPSVGDAPVKKLTVIRIVDETRFDVQTLPSCSAFTEGRGDSGILYRSEGIFAGDPSTDLPAHPDFPLPGRPNGLEAGAEGFWIERRFAC